MIDVSDNLKILGELLLKDIQTRYMYELIEWNLAFFAHQSSLKLYSLLTSNLLQTYS